MQAARQKLSCIRQSITGRTGIENLGASATIEQKGGGRDNKKRASRTAYRKEYPRDTSSNLEPKKWRNCPPHALSQRDRLGHNSLAVDPLRGGTCRILNESRSDQRRTWPRSRAVRWSGSRQPAKVRRPTRTCGCPQQGTPAARRHQSRDVLAVAAQSEARIPAGQCINGRWYFLGNGSPPGTRSRLRPREPLIITAFHQYRSSSEWATGI